NAEVLLDGGIRRGSDVVKALCIGARAVLIGRAYAYGLGAAGAAGVARAIEILRSDMIRTMKLLGRSSIRDLDRSSVEMPAEWQPKDAGGPPTLDEIDRLRVHGARPLTQSIIDFARQREP